MPQTSAVTVERVEQAIEALRRRGEPLTNARIREELGGGSFTTITKLLREWRIRDEAQRQNGSDTSADASLRLPQQLVEVIYALEAALRTLTGAAAAAIQGAVAEERQRGDLFLEEVRRRMQIAAAQEVEQREAAEAEVAALEGKIDAALSEHSATHELNNVLKTEVDSLRNNLALMSATISERDRDICDALRTRGELEAHLARQNKDLQEVKDALFLARQEHSRLLSTQQADRLSLVKSEERLESANRQLEGERSGRAEEVARLQRELMDVHARCEVLNGALLRAQVDQAMIDEVQAMAMTQLEAQGRL